MSPLLPDIQHTSPLGSAYSLDFDFPISKDTKEWFQKNRKPHTYIVCVSLSVGRRNTIDSSFEELESSLPESFYVIIVGNHNLQSKESSKMKITGPEYFETLFPLCDAVYHQGGAGSTFIAMLSGKPQLFQNSKGTVGFDKRVNKKSCIAMGITPTYAYVGENVKFSRDIWLKMRDDIELQKNCERIREKALAEHGLQKITNIILDNVRNLRRNNVRAVGGTRASRIFYL